MGLTQDYREDVESVKDSMDKKIMGEDALSLKKSLDDVLPFIFLLLGFSILFGFVLPVNHTLAVYVTWANYVVIAYFAVRLVVEFRLSNSSDSFFKDHWLDMLMVIPAVSIIQEARLFRFIGGLQFLDDIGLAARNSKLLTGSATLEGTGIAARLTKIARMIKRSIGF